MKRLQPEETSIWTEPPSSPSLETGTVHVWRIALSQEDDRLERFRSTLDLRELERAGRFHFDKHRRHFIVARGFLRSVVASYLGVQPRALQFEYGAYGKPALTSGHALRFNLSHSNEVALLAVAIDAELGVDVEHIRPDFAGEDIARRYFSRAEVDVFNTLPPEERVAAFFRCWTRKEAYIKAIGKGFSQALDAFDVTLAPGVAPALLRAEDDEVSRWWMSDVEVGEGYAGALIVERPVAQVSFFRQD